MVTRVRPSPRCHQVITNRDRAFAVVLGVRKDPRDRATGPGAWPSLTGATTCRTLAQPPHPRTRPTTTAMCAGRCYDSKPKQGVTGIKSGRPRVSSNSSGTTTARCTARRPGEGPRDDDVARFAGQRENLRADARDQVHRPPDAAGDVGVAAVSVPPMCIGTHDHPSVVLTGATRNRQPSGQGQGADDSVRGPSQPCLGAACWTTSKDHRVEPAAAGFCFGASSPPCWWAAFMGPSIHAWKSSSLRQRV